MEIVYKDISELVPYKDNPRKNDEAVDYVANSIREFGFRVPLVVKSDGEIIAGHTRYKACLQLGIEKVPCVLADDLTEDQIKAFRLADNKVSEMAGWDMFKLDEELETINLDMEQFGFVDWKDLNIDDFVTDNTREKKTKTIVCPHCGEIIEL